MSQDPSEDETRTPERPIEGIAVSPLAGGTGGRREGSFTIAEWTDEGGPLGPPRLIAPLHVHHRDDEAWYVLEGTLTFRLADREVEAPARSAVFVPPGVAHTFWNPGPGSARYLLIMTPNVRRLIEELHALTERDPETVRSVYRRHGSELLG